jgi:hypothetical protein
VSLLVGLFAAGPMTAQQPADTVDKPINLGSQSAYLGEIDRFPLQISGFGVGDYSYAGRTGANSFSAGKVAVGVFREITRHAYVFGQLTTALHADEAGGEPVTETEIDNLLVSLVPPGASNLSLNFGKLDLPIGFERDDEPLNFLASPSFNFELGRPVKMVGLQGTWTKPWVEQAVGTGLLKKFQGMRYSDDVGGALRQVSAGDVGQMPYWEAQVITTAVHHGLVLYHYLFQEAS